MSKLKTTRQLQSALIREIRLKVRMTQKQLATAYNEEHGTNWGVSAISNIEVGEAQFSTVVMDKLLSYMGYRVCALMYDTIECSEQGAAEIAAEEAAEKEESENQ